MNKKPIIKMLNIITERNPNLRDTFQYTYIMRIMEKDARTIAYAEKMYVRDNLRSLCEVAGLSYERLLMRVCK